MKAQNIYRASQRHFPSASSAHCHNYSIEFFVQEAMEINYKQNYPLVTGNQLTKIPAPKGVFLTEKKTFEKLQISRHTTFAVT